MFFFLKKIYWVLITVHSSDRHGCENRCPTISLVQLVSLSSLGEDLVQFPTAIAINLKNKVTDSLAEIINSVVCCCKLNNTRVCDEHFLDKLAHVQVVINSRYSSAQICTWEDAHARLSMCAVIWRHELEWAHNSSLCKIPLLLSSSTNLTLKSCYRTDLFY